MLVTKDSRIKIGIPYYYMHPLNSLNDFTKKFARHCRHREDFCVKTVVKISFI